MFEDDAAPDPPIGCSLAALGPDGRRRQKALLEMVRGHVLETAELADGYALRLPAEATLFRDLAEWVALERRCCAFAEFTLEWRRDDTVWVRVTGSPGAKEVLAAEMGLGTD
jgi:hypothetical protein